MEEKATLNCGDEYYHNFHEYDYDGNRIRTIYTLNNKVIEIREDPPTDNILDEGVTIQKDKFGNWLQKVFEYDDTNGSIIIREITYHIF